jgi:5-methylcytosine-specific restriction endonuclease McrA
MKPTPEKQREYQQRYKAKPGIRERYRQLNKDWIANNRDQYNQAKALYRFKLKIAAIAHYSGGTMACAHCAFNADLDALCLDHINDDGAAHRKELGCAGRNNPAGTTIYERLKAKGWMPNLQVLCFNCNTIKELRRKRGGLKASEMLEASKSPNRWAAYREAV